MPCFLRCLRFLIPFAIHPSIDLIFFIRILFLTRATAALLPYRELLLFLVAVYFSLFFLSFYYLLSSSWQLNCIYTIHLFILCAVFCFYHSFVRTNRRLCDSCLWVCVSNERSNEAHKRWTSIRHTYTESAVVGVIRANRRNPHLYKWTSMWWRMSVQLSIHDRWHRVPHAVRGHLNRQTIFIYLSGQIHSYVRFTVYGKLVYNCAK